MKAKDAHGLHPQNIKELDERLGEDYRISWISITLRIHFFEATLPRNYDGEMRISFFRPDPYAPFELKHLPPDEWIIERFKLMFGFDEQTALSITT